MRTELLSREDLLSAGWTDRQIDAALDEGDQYGPSGHWLNTTGKPYYDRGRVAVAAYRVGLRTRKPPAALWKEWSTSERPSCLAELTFNFHRLAALCIEGAAHRFWSLRLSHPYAGRQPGTRDQESDLIEHALIALVGHAFDTELTDADLYAFLSAQAPKAERLFGPSWAGDVVVRPARRQSYVSKGTSKPFLQRCIGALALVHTGQVRNAAGRKCDVTDLLIYAPSLRFDRSSL